MYRYDPRQRYQLDTNPLIVTTQSLLGQVLGITGVGFLITAATSYVGISQALAPSASFLAMIVGFVLLFSIYGTQRNAALSLALFYAFTACEGIGLAPVIGMYLRTAGPDVVYNAALTTGLGMSLLAAIVYATSYDFRKLSGIAMIGLLGLVAIGILSLFVHIVHPQFYAWATLAIFTLLVLIDFTRIRAGGDMVPPVQLALSIYLDGINIFLALLRIFGGRSRDD